MATGWRSATGPSGDPLAEVTELTKRLKLPYLRRALNDLLPTAKAQRCEPAEVVRVLLAEEAAGRDAANLHTRRKRAGFPAGKTFHDWDESASSVGFAACGRMLAASAPVGVPAPLASGACWPPAGDARGTRTLTQRQNPGRHPLVARHGPPSAPVMLPTPDSH